MNNKEKFTKFALVALILAMSIVACLFFGGRIAGNGGMGDTISVRVDTISDTIIVLRRDTVPVEKERRVVSYVRIPVYVPPDSIVNDSGTITLPVVQKTYSDDSTYTAYVSGVEYDSLPRLDSIITRLPTVTNTITKTVTIQKPMRRWNVGVQAGYGYGFSHKGFEPYVGVGVTYRIF